MPNSGYGSYPMARILITGSNSGFGELAALTAARSGHEVVATMRNLAKGDGLRDAIANEGLPIEIRPLDDRWGDEEMTAEHAREFCKKLIGFFEEGMLM